MRKPHDASQKFVGIRLREVCHHENTCHAVLVLWFVSYKFKKTLPKMASTCAEYGAKSANHAVSYQKSKFSTNKKDGPAWGRP
jgi:hypothetical protein